MHSGQTESQSSNLVSSEVASPIVEPRPQDPFGLDDLLFDEAYYAAKYPEAALEVRQGGFESLRTHYEKKGFLARWRPSPLFVPSAYFLDPRSRFVVGDGVDPITHYLSVGASRRASPHWLFDEAFYLSEYPDVRRAVEHGSFRSGFHHFLLAGIRELRHPHVLFNPVLYVRLSGVGADRGPFVHYACHGAFEGFRTSGLFDARWYASRSRDITPYLGDGQWLDCPLHHFVQFGMAEGRLPASDFDPEFYSRQYPEVLEEIQRGSCPNAVAHWITRGARKGLAPNASFDTEYYLRTNPEVATEVGLHGLSGPFEHFVLFGRGRGLRCRPPVVQVPAAVQQATAAYTERARIGALLARAVPRVPRSAADSMPDVSIVIPVRDQSDFTLHLVADLASRKTRGETEIVVVDDASTDQTRELARTFPEITVLRNEASVGFAAACNQGFRAARGQVILFANADIEVMPGAIDALLGVFDADPDVAAVGARVVGASDGVEDVGGLPANVRFGSAVFMGVRRSVLDVLGGFDEVRSAERHEEVDLCARIWSSGGRVVVAPNAIVRHFALSAFAGGRPSMETPILARRPQVALRSAPAEVALLGHSHTQAIQSAYDGASEGGARPFKLHRVLLGEYEPVLPAGIDLNPALVAALTRLQAENPIQAVFLSVYGNAHTLFGLVKHPRPFDFVLEEQPELPLDTDSEVVPEAFVEAALMDHVAFADRLIGALARHLPMPVFHVESAPPVRSAEAILATQETVFWDALRLGELGVASAFLRYKLWRLHSRLVRDACVRHGVVFIPAPPETQDADGFLLDHATRRGDATHGNAWYGERVLSQMAGAVTALVGKTPRAC